MFWMVQVQVQHLIPAVLATQDQGHDVVEHRPSAARVLTSRYDWVYHICHRIIWHPSRPRIFMNIPQFSRGLACCASAVMTGPSLVGDNPSFSGWNTKKKSRVNMVRSGFCCMEMHGMPCSKSYLRSSPLVKPSFWRFQSLFARSPSPRFGLSLKGTRPVPRTRSKAKSEWSWWWTSRLLKSRCEQRRTRWTWTCREWYTIN